MQLINDFERLKVNHCCQNYCYYITVHHFESVVCTQRTDPFNDPLSRTTRMSRYHKGETDLDLTEARDSEWHWHQLDHMQVCISLQTDSHASTPPLSFFSFLKAGCPSCRPTNSVKALKAVSVVCSRDKWTRFGSLRHWPRPLRFVSVKYQRSRT